MNDYAEQVRWAHREATSLAEEAVAWAVATGARGDFRQMKAILAALIEEALLEHYRAGLRERPETTRIIRTR